MPFAHLARRAVLLLAGPCALVAAACAHTPRAARARSSTHAGGPAATGDSDARVLPASIDDFVRRSQERFEDPNDGLMAHYQTASPLGATVFVYPDTGSADVPDSAAVRAETQRAIAQILAFAGGAGTRGSPMAIQLRTVAGPAGPRLAGARGGAILRERGGFVEADVHVFRIGREFLKVRATYPTALGGAGARNRVSVFASGIAVAYRMSSSR